MSRAPRGGSRAPAALRFGLPLVLLVAGGSLALSVFVGEKYAAVDARVQKRSARAAAQEEERRRALAALTVEDDYVNVRVPPPPASAPAPAPAAGGGGGGGGGLR